MWVVEVERQRVCLSLFELGQQPPDDTHTATASSEVGVFIEPEPSEVRMYLIELVKLVGPEPVFREDQDVVVTR